MGSYPSVQGARRQQQLLLDQQKLEGQQEEGAARRSKKGQPASQDAKLQSIIDAEKKEKEDRPPLELTKIGEKFYAQVSA